MPFVKIAYDPDLSKIGDTIEVDDATAREMVGNGHGRIVRKPADTPKKRASRKSTAKAAKAKPAEADEPSEKDAGGPTSGHDLGENGVTAVAD